MKILPLLTLAIVECCLLGCATVQNSNLVETVGPGPLKWAGKSPRASLIVYTATECHPDGGTYYYPHQGYLIYTEAGRLLESVANHVGTMDQAPAIVPLPPGNYTILAPAEGYGRIRVPVQIEPHRPTVVYLDRQWQPPAGTDPATLVRMPGGPAIGWRADPTPSGKTSAH
jgi:hypothetical protein